jgi:hypothetical protein
VSQEIAPQATALTEPASLVRVEDRSPSRLPVLLVAILALPRSKKRIPRSNLRAGRFVWQADLWDPPPQGENGNVSLRQAGK